MTVKLFLLGMVFLRRHSDRVFLLYQRVQTLSLIWGYLLYTCKCFNSYPFVMVAEMCFKKQELKEQKILVPERVPGAGFDSASSIGR
jgi:hypothetical protein